jgi:hypothetical protein
LAGGRARARAVTCDDCFFRARNLCALGLDEPCPTFRPDGPEGLIPPVQTELRPRGGGQVAIGAAALEQPAA